MVSSGHTEQRVRTSGEMGGGGLVTYLALGSMTVEAGLGGAVAPALTMVHVEVQLEVDHLSVKLYESVWVAFHRTRKRARGEG